MEQQTVVRDHRTKYHHTPLINQPLVALDQLAVVLPRESTSVGNHKLYGTAAPDALIHCVFDGQDRGIDPVSEQLIEIHVDEDADFDRLEWISLRLLTAGWWIDRDVLDGNVGRWTAALPPVLLIRLADATFKMCASSVRNVCHRSIRLRDSVVEGSWEHTLGVLQRAGCTVGFVNDATVEVCADRFGLRILLRVVLLLCHEVPLRVQEFGALGHLIRITEL